jgi:hypothetical protein
MARSQRTASAGASKIKEDEPRRGEQDAAQSPKLFLFILIFIFIPVVLLSPLPD